MKSLSSQALQKLGKGWVGASETREAKLQEINRFTNYVEKTFGLQDIHNLKPGHINAYADSIRGEVSPRTGANYMAYVRDVCHAIGKPGICARDNAAYGFGGVARQNPQQLNVAKVAEINSVINARAAAGDRVALMMSAAADMRPVFGLRHKEALMSCKTIMINGKPHLVVEGAKTGKPRVVGIETEAQRNALTKVAETAATLGNGNGRIMPPELSLKQALQAESREWHKLGGTREAKASMHIARHDFVQKERAAGKSKEQINVAIGHGNGRSIGSYSEK